MKVRVEYIRVNALNLSTGRVFQIDSKLAVRCDQAHSYVKVHLIILSASGDCLNTNSIRYIKYKVNKEPNLSRNKRHLFIAMCVAPEHHSLLIVGSSSSPAFVFRGLHHAAEHGQLLQPLVSQHGLRLALTSPRSTRRPSYACRTS